MATLSEKDIEKAKELGYELFETPKVIELKIMGFEKDNEEYRPMLMVASNINRAQLGELSNLIHLIDRVKQALLNAGDDYSEGNFSMSIKDYLTDIMGVNVAFATEEKMEGQK